MYRRFHFAAFMLLTFTMSISLATHGKSKVYEDVKDLAFFESTLEQYLSDSSGEVLLVYDIDDTLMESVSFFGGDTWYNWQRGRPIKHKSGGEVTIAPEDQLVCLFSKLGVFFDIGEYHPVEKSTLATVKTLQLEHDTLVLTSRSPDYRSGTQRILDGAGFDFIETSLLPKDYALFYDFHDGKNERAVSYANGVIMSSGLNKGNVLKDMLARFNKKYSAIFFIDDSYVNIENMKNAWQADETEVFIFHYTHVDKIISDNDIAQSRQARKALNAFMQVTFPARYQAFSNGTCQ